MKFKAAIFDMDGTLIDSMHMWSTIGSRFLLNRGIKPESDLNKKILTLSISEAIDYCLKTYNIEDSKEANMAEIARIAGQFYAEEAVCKPGVPEFLEKLRLRGIKMCVATMTDSSLAAITLKKNGIDGYFSSILCCKDIGASKESPAVYDSALTHLQEKKENTIVFEDALYAVRTARAAGYTVVGLHDNSEKQWEKLKEECSIFAESFADTGLLETIDNY